MSIEDKSTKLLDAISKQTLLAILTIIPSMICSVSYVITAILQHHNNAHESNVRIYIIFGENLLSLQLIFNAFYLVLQFSMYDKEYYKICRKCHYFCSNCCKIDSVDIPNRNVRISSRASSVGSVGSIGSIASAPSINSPDSAQQP